METILMGYIESWKWYNEYQDRFERDLVNNRSQNIDMIISSSGGSVEKGLQLSALVKTHTGNTRAICVGFVASIATIIASSADKVVIDTNSTWLIHNVRGGAMGTAKEIRKTADQVDGFDEQIMSFYVSRIAKNGKLVNGSIEETKKMLMDCMEEERVLSAQECLDMGLVDAIINCDTPKEITDKADELIGQIEQAYPKFTNAFPNFRNCYKPKSQEQVATQKKSDKGFLTGLVNGFKSMLNAVGLGFKNDVEIVETQSDAIEEKVTESATEIIETTTNNQDENMTPEQMIEALKQQGFDVSKANNNATPPATTTPPAVTTTENNAQSELEKLRAEFEAQKKELSDKLAALEAAKNSRPAGSNEPEDLTNSQTVEEQERQQRKNKLLGAIGAAMKNQIGR